jgi:lipid A disaccharide synthetase
LIIKPKQPALIKNIFDKIGKIYEKAIDSGRCYIYFEHDKYGLKNTKIPVSEASMAADLSIHNTLLSGTAGIESALSGTPTIFYDDFFIKKSLFYKYGENKIVFNDWNRMWSYLYSNIIKETIEKNSNWNSFLNHIDPFRDGKSSIRINKFVGNLSKFYKEGIQKKIALNEAKKIYANEWGKDKIKNFDKNFL